MHLYRKCGMHAYDVHCSLRQKQHGFVPNRSTSTKLLQYNTIIAECLNNMESCDIILLDFTKTFDKVCHNALLARLSSFGICGKLHE